MSQTNLPVEQILGSLKQHLQQSNQVVLQAPPGTGKTTVVPLALLDQRWLGSRKILMLEPRRIAAKAAAHRMAGQLNESPGQTIGYRMRMDSRVSSKTRIEVITEGVLTRMIQQDPALQDVGLVIFDEFHERSLDSDLALALCLHGRELFREESAPLKILIMSATIDTDAIAKLVENTAVVKCEGTNYAVDIIYGSPRNPRERPTERVVATVIKALGENPHSSILAFLPGQSDIRRASEQLSGWLQQNQRHNIDIYPLYGHLSIEQQQKAISPIPDSSDSRKVVLATNIAETSLTIEGVNVIVDCGLAKESRFNPSTAMSGLQTVKISTASSIQRAGRAGRTGPGKCYRLWSEQQQQQLDAQITPEILQADLATLSLQLLKWGVSDPDELKWLDSPPRGAWQQALDLLTSLGALQQNGAALTLSPHGETMAAFGIHPRLAHLLICGTQSGFAEQASLVASLLTERSPSSNDNPDIHHQLQLLSGDIPSLPGQHNWIRRVQQQARQYQKQLSNLVETDNIYQALDSEQLCGYLLACAYPDRIARRRHAGAFQLANGRSAAFIGNPLIAGNQWLVIAEVNAMQGNRSDTIRSAASLDKTLLSTLLKSLVTTETVTDWDTGSGRFIAKKNRKVGALTLASEELKDLPADLKLNALIQMIKGRGEKLLPWNSAHHQWLARLNLLRQYDQSSEWPDLSIPKLIDTVEHWLAPYLTDIDSLNALKKLDLGTILNSMLDWQMQQKLNQLAPVRIEVPSGSSIAIDYCTSPPVLAVKLQEMFGCSDNPAVINGKVALTVHLLSPAGRPLQVTQDLAGFWQNTYHDVKKEMKGRYPKHPWPDDPLTAVPTARTKARMNQ